MQQKWSMGNKPPAISVVEVFCGFTIQYRQYSGLALVILIIILNWFGSCWEPEARRREISECFKDI